MPRCDRETDLVVELRRCRYVAFLLDMKSHAGGTGRNAATIRSEMLGDNWGCVLWTCDNLQLPSFSLGSAGQGGCATALLVGRSADWRERYRQENVNQACKYRAC